MAFAGNFSQFSLSGLADKAKIEGLRVHGSKDDLDALVTKAEGFSSTSARNAIKRGIRLMDPLEFQIELKRICDGNVPNVPNPNFYKRLYSGGKIYAWGLDESQTKILTNYLQKNGLMRGVMRKESLALAITSSIYLNTSGAKILKVMGVPVYDFARVKNNFLD